MFRPARLASFAIVAVLAAVVAACDSGGEPADPAGGPTSDPASSATSSPAALAIDWEHPEDTHLPDGWRLSFCDGEARLVCVDRDGQPVGYLEVLGFEVAGLSDFSDALAAHGEAAALDDHARRFVADFTADRAEGCGTDYRVTATPTQRLATADGMALRYGFVGTYSDGRPSEYVLHYGGVRETRLALLVATASDPGGCLSTDGQYFTSETLAAFTPLLDRLVVGGGLPSVPS